MVASGSLITPQSVLDNVSPSINSVSFVPDTGNAMTITTPPSGSTYTIPSNGYLCVNVRTTQEGQYLAFKVVNSSGQDVWGAVNYTNSFFPGYPIVFYPVHSGDIVKFDYNCSILRVQFIRALQL